MFLAFKQKGLIFNERLIGTYRDIKNPIEIKSFILDIEARAKTIENLIDKYNATDYHNLRIKGKIYMENFAYDDNISGNMNLYFSDAKISYYIDFKNCKNEFCYLEGEKILSIFTFIRDITSFSGSIFNKEDNEKIFDVRLINSKKKLLEFVKNFKLV